MTIFFNKKIKNIFSGLYLGIMIFVFVFSVSLIPKKADAQMVVEDPGNLVQNTLNVVNTTTSAITDYYRKYKDTVLDKLATIAAKQLIRYITASVVQWINSGFEGSPSFLQNPGSFFLDVADQVTGEFLARTGGPLTALCSPFSIDIRLALAFKYRPKVLQRYTCTLGTIIKNSKNAVANASINGFTAGDFRQGGWPAFVSLSTEPQNNVYGAYLTADADLSWRVASAQASQKDEISAGNGFLSWRDPNCKKKVKEYNANLSNNTATPEDGTGEGTTLSPQLKSVNDCPIQTPGSTIAGSLQNHLNGPLRELELVDSINQIVNALFAQLITQVLQKGLTSVSSKGQDSSTYLDSTVKEINNEANPEFQKTKTELITNISVYKKNAIEYKKNRDDALNILLDIKNAYDAAKACYNTKINANPPVLKPFSLNEAKGKVAEIDNVIAVYGIATKALDLLTLAQSADAQLKSLQDIEDKVNAAKGLNDLNGPSQEYGALLSAQKLVTPTDIQRSKQDLDTARAQVGELKNDAMRRLQACQILN